MATSTDHSEFLPNAERIIGGVNIKLVEGGNPDAPLVVLLHGFPDFSYGFRKQFKALVEQGFHVIAPDQRGYNQSGKPRGLRSYHPDRLAQDVVDLAHVYGRRRFHVVGHDFGGLVGWRLASEHPNRIEKLVIINAPHPAAYATYVRRHPTQLLKSSYILFFQTPFVPEMALRHNDFDALTKALVRSSRPGTFSASDLARYRAAWSEPGALPAMLDWYRALVRVSPRSYRPEPISVPTMILWGVKDAALERGLASASLDLCDDGHIVWFDDATHWVQLEESEMVNKRLTNFFGAPLQRETNAEI